MIFKDMKNDLKRYISELSQILNDEALFHQREIPGDQDDFEDRGIQDPNQTRHTLYVCINEMIEIYDKIEEGTYSDARIKEAVNKVSSAINNLKMKI